MQGKFRRLDKKFGDCARLLAHLVREITIIQIFVYFSGSAVPDC